jgi:uncharacterized cupin superfamily protein
MSEIKIEAILSKRQLDESGVTGCPIWSREAWRFSWSQDASGTCCFLEGARIVTPDGGEPVAMGKGDLVTFPSGMCCT